MYSYLTKIDAGKLKGKMIKEDGAQTQISAICMRVSDFLFIFAAEKKQVFDLIALQILYFP